MKKVCGFLRSKFFAYLENEFVLAEEEDIVATAVAAIEELVGECSSFDDKNQICHCGHRRKAGCFRRWPDQRQGKAALDNLCAKGILYGGEKFILDMYALCR